MHSKNSLGSLVAFQAMVSIATIGLYIAYALPIFFRVTLARRSFVPGPFNLGKYSIFVGWVAVPWVATIAVLFSLPVAYPITKDTLNYTPVAVGGVVFVTFSLNRAGPSLGSGFGCWAGPSQKVMAAAQPKLTPYQAGLGNPMPHARPTSVSRVTTCMVPVI
ncbi:Amino-acid permease BAT1-like protein [Nymphaea thermarum]|nr:Amino-acid permease BAT1-like protein [Nymphaea thermarum]